ncbi:sensor domain-containing diguanylate cyclase [Aeromonas fluvialis]|uniref:sensor domain-containing diguanylate cyclase n=1 Tax=Aeromonas fluvialis TaxID=591962 RepID=UPI000A02582A|nr:sensor domain-containing diguanylate cyclase [Aeromonas fluvialis]
MKREHYLKKELYELIKSDDSIFDFIQKASLDGIWYWNLEKTNDEWMSPEFWQVLGYEHETMPHSPDSWQSIINQDDLKIAIDNFNKHIEDEKHPYDQIVRYKHKDGSTVWIHCRGIAIRNSNGKPIRMLGAHNDITRVKILEERNQRNLKAVDELYATTKLDLFEAEAIFKNLPDGILQADEYGFITKVNDAVCSMLGYAEQKLLAMNVDDIVPQEHRSNHAKQRQQYFESPTNRNMLSSPRSVFAQHRNGTKIPVEIRLNTLATRYGKRILVSLRDVTEHNNLVNSLKIALAENKSLNIEVSLDPLAKLKNRRFFEEAAIREFANSKRHTVPLSIAIFDIDHFKDVNDKYGHAVGDEVLKALSNELNNHVRAGDTLARIGGEEFAVLLPSTSLVAAEILLERIRVSIKKLKFANDTPSLITASIGVSTVSDNDYSYQEVLQRADKALYTAKENGRDKVIFNI